MTSEALTCAAVVLGDFAPAMFHPSWFQRLGLIGETEASAAVMDQHLVVSESAARCSFGGMDLHVFQDRFQIGTSREDLHDPLRDLLKSVMVILDSTPVKAFGINWSKHFRVSSEEKWHALGDRLAPKDFWRKNWNAHAGLMRLLIRLERSDSYAGSVNVTVDPSGEISTGVYVKFNDHYEIKNGNTGDLNSLIEDIWVKSKKNAVDLIVALEHEANHG